MNQAFPALPDSVHTWRSDGVLTLCTLSRTRRAPTDDPNMWNQNRIHHGEFGSENIGANRGTCPRCMQGRDVAHARAGCGTYRGGMWHMRAHLFHQGEHSTNAKESNVNELKYISILLFMHSWLCSQNPPPPAQGSNAAGCTHLRMVILYRRFRRAYRSDLQGSRSLCHIWGIPCDTFGGQSGTGTGTDTGFSPNTFISSVIFIPQIVICLPLKMHDPRCWQRP
jgi:hypothetical protein